MARFTEDEARKLLRDLEHFGELNRVQGMPIPLNVLIQAAGCMRQLLEQCVWDDRPNEGEDPPIQCGTFQVELPGRVRRPLEVVAEALGLSRPMVATLEQVIRRAESVTAAARRAGWAHTSHDVPPERLAQFRVEERRRLLEAVGAWFDRAADYGPSQIDESCPVAKLEIEVFHDDIGATCTLQATGAAEFV